MQSKKKNMFFLNLCQVKKKWFLMFIFYFLQFFIIIIIKKGQQCKAGREWYTAYQSKDPSPTIPTYRQKEEKGKESRRV